MAKAISIGNLKPTSGNSVSHSKRRVKRTFRPNVVKKTLVVNGVKQTILTTARVLKSINKTPRVRTKAAKTA